jgi:hypothetical protein
VYDFLLVALAQLDKSRNEQRREIVNAKKTVVFEGANRKTFAGAKPVMTMISRPSAMGSSRLLKNSLAGCSKFSEARRESSLRAKGMAQAFPLYFALLCTGIGARRLSAPFDHAQDNRHLSLSAAY